MIPKSVTRADLMEACEPLFALLGLDPNATYLPLVLGHGSIDFSISPAAKREGVTPAPDLRDGEAYGVVAHHYAVAVN